MSVLDDASLVLIPSGYKASKLYSVVPTSGDGDLTFSRSTTATRVNADGVIETVAINVPRIDFTGGGCGKLLLEPQRTNLYLNSATLVTQNITTAADVYTVEFEGTGTITFSGTYSGSLVGTGANDRVSLTFTATSGTLTSTVSGSCTDAQAEVGSYATSHIPTAGSTVTRNKDEINSTNVNSWSSVEGTLYLKLQSFDNNSYKQLSLYGSSSDNLTVSYTDTPNEIRVIMKIAGVTVIFFSYVMTNQLLINKIAITYSSGRVKLYINGFLRGSSTVSYTTSEGLWTKFVNNIGANYNYFYGNLYEMSISKISSTDTQMVELTTI